MPIECQLELFDNIVLPILLNGSEIWGFENTNILERVHTMLSKKSTPNFAVYAELDIHPITVSLKLRMINF